MYRTRTAPLLAGEGATLETVPTTIHSSRLYIGVDLRLCVVLVWVKRKLDSLTTTTIYQILSGYALRYRGARSADQLQILRGRRDNTSAASMIHAPPSR